jgi:hypothetical protein
VKPDDSLQRSPSRVAERERRLVKETMVKKRGIGSALRTKAKRGFRGYPVATVAFYGPDNQRASKVAVGIVVGESNDVVDLKRWFSESSDVRSDPSIAAEVEEFLRSHGVRSVVITDGLLGCPHEEGTDYPDGQSCPKCPYWAGRDRFSGERVH